MHTHNANAIIYPITSEHLFQQKKSAWPKQSLCTAKAEKKRNRKRDGKRNNEKKHETQVKQMIMRNCKKLLVFHSYLSFSVMSQLAMYIFFVIIGDVDYGKHCRWLSVPKVILWSAYLWRHFFPISLRVIIFRLFSALWSRIIHTYLRFLFM